MAKERPLTAQQMECLKAAKDTLFGDVKMSGLYARSVRGLRVRGLVDGEKPHISLPQSGKAKLAEVCHA